MTEGINTGSRLYHLVTFGCQMNKGDSDLMRYSLNSAGFTETGSIEDASIAVYNTCSVRDHAERRAIGIITSNNRHIREKNGITVVAGCMAQRIGNDLIMKGIADLIIGPYRSPDIGGILNRYADDRSAGSHLTQRHDLLADRLPLGYARDAAGASWHEWVTISHGCDNRCSYCIVPSVRGGLISFPSKSILEYLAELSRRGVREITLLGQNVNQYGTDSGDMRFPELLEKTCRMSGFERVNFITSHPKDFSDDIIRVIRDYPNITRSIHLPLQSGSDRILGAMNRGYVMKDYYRIVESLHRSLDRFAVSTDLIVGFPGETENEFLKTLEAVESIRFDEAFTYAYSPRQGTPAFDLEERCGVTDKKERLRKLIEVQRKISAERLRSRIDSVEDTIIERISKKSARSVMGKTFLNHPVIIPGSGDDIGKKIKIKIQSVKGSTLQGIRIA